MHNRGVCVRLAAVELVPVATAAQLGKIVRRNRIRLGGDHTSGPMKDTDAMTEGNHVLETGYRTQYNTVHFTVLLYTVHLLTIIHSDTMVSH